jgi:hypothetical protein
MLEYIVRKISMRREKEINRLAQEGWRLVCVSDGFHYFERYKETPTIDSEEESIFSRAYVIENGVK